MYIAAQDGECREKTMTVAPDGTVWFETLVENAGVPGRASGNTGYTVTAGAFMGDWWTAAHLYRDWALRQRWASKGKIAFRSDFPKKAIDTQRKQPPDAGERGQHKDSTKINVAQLTDDEFDKLPESKKAQLRGDFLA